MEAMSFWRYHSVDFTALNAVGSLGGFVLMWDKSVFLMRIGTSSSQDQYN